MRIGDKVTVPSGEEGVIVRESKHSSFDWWVELPEKEGGIPAMQLPFRSDQLKFDGEIKPKPPSYVSKL